MTIFMLSLAAFSVHTIKLGILSNSEAKTAEQNDDQSDDDGDNNNNTPVRLVVHLVVPH
ncbi:MAG: hypothetical protein LBB13_00375 [Rickettsiales bacterium]|nr:hypothetical protein [Rickettsiales bacterium]